MAIGPTLPIPAAEGTRQVEGDKTAYMDDSMYATHRGPKGRRREALGVPDLRDQKSITE